MNTGKSKQFLEWGLLLLLFLVCLHLIAERIAYSGIPGGDEGSWLSAAKELSQGGGFSTRWLEYHFLEPYTLPRPDDVRYPALVTLLGIAFALFGVSYHVGLWTVGGLFMLFCGLVYLNTRLYFNRSTAMITLILTIFSLLQLKWNTVVYSEGLFGVVLALIFLWMKLARDTLWKAGGFGLLLALLYLVRPNGLLLLPALLFYYWWVRTSSKQVGKKALLMLVVFGLCLLPWWIRNQLFFGNPFHIAGSAGLLRESAQEPVTYSVSTFLDKYGLLFMIKRVIWGTWEFFLSLQDSEHGLQWLPLSGVLIGLIRRKPFYNMFVSGAFLLTLFSCFYVSYNSWAGIRYFSSFVPFLYAYGIFQILSLLNKKSPYLLLNRFSLILMAALCLSPVYYPHRFYERKFSQAPPFAQEEIQTYVTAINTHVPESENYLALGLGQLNFLTHRNCIGMQGPEFEYATLKALDHFNPSHLALTREEFVSEWGLKIVALIQEKGFVIEPVGKYKLGIIFELQRREEAMEIVRL